MSLRALDGISPEWFTLPDDKDTEESEKAQFRIWPLTGPQLLDVNQYFDEESLAITGPGLLLAFRLSCRDWRNVKDRNGEDMVFSKSNIDYIPPQALAEVGSRSIKMSMMSEEELGNS